MEMGLIEWANQRIKALDVWDISILKTYCVLFGLVIGAYISDFVKQHLWVFVALIVLFGLHLSLKFFRRQVDSGQCTGR